MTRAQDMIPLSTPRENPLTFEERTLAKRPAEKTGYMPTLDGWRAIAILSVIFCHDEIHVIGAFNTRWYLGLVPGGRSSTIPISASMRCWCRHLSPSWRRPHKIGKYFKDTCGFGLWE